MAFELLSFKIELFVCSPDKRSWHVPGSQLFLKFGKPYYADKIHWIKIFTTLQRYVQENEFRYFEMYCITLSAHLVK